MAGIEAAFHWIMLIFFWPQKQGESNISTCQAPDLPEIDQSMPCRLLISAQLRRFSCLFT
jgi:hypothetical protein